MNDLWKNVIVTKIDVAVYVAPKTGRSAHQNRPFHGFVLNDAEANKDYYFNDGRILRTKCNSLFYLPKGSSYHVKSSDTGGCFAINFDADISDEPFSFSLRNADSVRHHFKLATDAWKIKDGLQNSLAMCAVYDAIHHMLMERTRQYVSSTHLAVITPAIEAIQESFSEKELKISHLASLCGISSVYLRRLFLNLFGISPKEYIIQKRIDYAKSLLQSRNFPVSEVAALCGYSEPCHFSREFSKRVGMSPTQYIKESFN